MKLRNDCFYSLKIVHNLNNLRRKSFQILVNVSKLRNLINQNNKVEQEIPANRLTKQILFEDFVKLEISKLGLRALKETTAD